MIKTLYTSISQIHSHSFLITNIDIRETLIKSLKNFD